MSRVTSKYQVTLPKSIADRYGIRPGDEIAWVPAGDVIHILLPREQSTPLDRDVKLRLFDQATERNRGRPFKPARKRARDRRWTREDLYDRGRPC